MAKQIQINATLVPVAQELSARPGDQLMIVAGVCVGVYTGKMAQHTLAVAHGDESMPWPAKGERNPKSGRKKGTPNKTGAPWQSRRDGADKAEYTDNPVLKDIPSARAAALEVILKHPEGISSGDLYRALGIRSSKAPGAWRLKAACVELAKEEKIRVSGKGMGAMRYPVIDKQQAA